MTYHCRESTLQWCAMPILETLRKYFGGVEREAASALPPQAPPKVRPGARALPAYLTTAKPNPQQPIPRSDRRLANQDVLNYRNGADTRTVIRDFAHSSPDLSAALWAYLRVGIPSEYTAIACSAVDGTIDVPATTLLQQIITRMDTLNPYEEGFSTTQSLKSLSESLAKEMLLYGSMAAELVLDKSRLPLKIQPISVTSVQFRPDGTSLKPFQKVGQDEFDLDLPTFFMLNLDQDLKEAYSSSPFETAIKPVLFKEDFAQDLHKIIKKVIHPRQKVKVDETMFRKFMSQEAQVDETVARAEMLALISEIENQINGLNPEDALVYFDTMDFEVDNPSNGNLANEYGVLQDISNSRITTGAKTMGTILGFQGGSSNIASSETMLFVKSANGAVKDKLDQLYSRIFTLALRLFGLDVFVRFRYADIDLRPQADLAAFRQTQQMMILEQLSFGLITDEEACLKLTGKLPPSGYVPKSGTMFHQGNPAQAAGTQEPTNSGSTLNQNLNGDTPAVGRGQNKKNSGAT